MSVRATLVRILALVTDWPSTGNRPGDVLSATTDNATAIVAPDGSPLRLDQTSNAVTTFAGVLGGAGNPRTITYTVTGLRPNQRAIINVAWGNPSGAETFLPSLGGGAPAGAAILGAPVTALRGSVTFVTGAADGGGSATVPVTFTASAPASCTVYASVTGAALDGTDVQTVAFT